MRIRKNFERQEGVKSGRLVVIAAEGRKTENIYFEEMKNFLHASNVQIKVLQRDTNNSCPEDVYRQIQAFAKEYNIDVDDQLWVVVDKDNWKDKMLSNVATKCSQNKYFNFCVSNPCFELWLILHLEDVEGYTEEKKNSLAENKKHKKNDATWTKNRLRELMKHYSESKYDANELLPTIDTSIERAQKLDTNKKARWPQQIGTRVYRLVSSILEKE